MADGAEKEEPDEVRRQVILSVRCAIDVPAHMDEDAVKFYVQEHMCKSDLIMSLAEQIAHDDEKGECNVCVFAEAVVVPIQSEHPSAWLANLPPPAPASFRLGGDEEEEAEDAEDAEEDEADDVDNEEDIDEDDTEPGEKKDTGD